MKLIGFSGKKQAGKDTGARTLGTWYQDLDFLTNRVRYLSLAEPLKKFCQDWFDLPHEAVWGTDEDKNRPTQHLWENLPGELAQGRTGPMTGREILQVWGTDVLRKFWTRVHTHQLKLAVERARKEGVKLSLVNDVRFPDEVAAIWELGGTVIRLTRAPFAEDAHASEVALDNMVWDDIDPSLAVVIDNKDFTLEEYHERIVEIGNDLLG